MNDKIKGAKSERENRTGMRNTDKNMKQNRQDLEKTQTGAQ